MPYTSDLTDKEWEVLEPLVTYIGPCRPRKYTIREVLNAIFYLEKTGCQWRMLPAHFPPWKSVYDLYYRWRRNGKWDLVHDTLRDQVREKLGKQAIPSAAIMDSRSVKTAQKGGQKAMMQQKK